MFYGDKYASYRIMMDEDWFEENNNDIVKDFIFNKVKLEDPLSINNPQTCITIDLTSIKMCKRVRAAVCILADLLNADEFIFCEYGVIGIDQQRRYIKGHPNKENCFEFKSKAEDRWYAYDNITYIRVNKERFRFDRYVQDVIYKNYFWNNYYFISLNHNFAVRMYDERGISIVYENITPLKKVLASYKDLINF